ncbi:zinc-dependent alcohol dehydrogenase [Enterovibrio nigricans]|uniref:2-desacetyl-2-hydroxyethyl bacteriochlorophyllide A dehydrogenase n=1 Tax=Enterovibrio nigricans DSM 22720 TaxID=1121868 RepID=A0A1T4USN8_9GAMM|nr:alcohol dehydrogenase catalytic domain-containing protein [Enterovibrio nigricans]PKF49046.1 Zn-dependent alcohol dehydrogenase [Enterovibrio nigricans]SKA55674.1 2-desacetyl-2-hydroxyethyl bacteriochlorophyllide A dehydrogenase [Enterovibrio nigricans DSM 22720]
MTKAAFYEGNKTFTVESVSISPPKEDEVQIRVAYCGICGTDVHVYHGHMDARVGTHRVIGHEMSGVIHAVGDDVKGVTLGDRVVVRPLNHCCDCSTCQRGLKHICENLKFLGLDTDGAFQEYWSVPAHTIHHLPDEVSLAHAAIVEPLAVACHDINRARVVTGEDVLVIGGGPIGMLIAMVAREIGAKVTICEIDEKRIAYAQGLGFNARHAKDGDLVEQLHSDTDGRGFNAIFDTSGVQAGVDLFTQVSASQARICMVAIHTSKPTIDLFKFFWQELELLGARVYEDTDFEYAIRLLREGKVNPDDVIIDKHSLDDIQSAFIPPKDLSMKTLIAVNSELN